jgi:hypothetical protein
MTDPKFGYCGFIPYCSPWSVPVFSETESRGVELRIPIRQGTPGFYEEMPPDLVPAKPGRVISCARFNNSNRLALQRMSLPIGAELLRDREYPEHTSNRVRDHASCVEHLRADAFEEVPESKWRTSRLHAPNRSHRRGMDFQTESDVRHRSPPRASSNLSCGASEYDEGLAFPSQSYFSLPPELGRRMQKAFHEREGLPAIPPNHPHASSST